MTNNNRSVLKVFCSLQFWAVLVCIFLPTLRAVIDKSASFVLDVSPSVCSPPPVVTTSTEKQNRSKVVIFPNKLLGNTHQTMILDEKRRIIIDWTAKAACTKVVEMFWNEMNITRGRSYPEEAFIHNYRTSFYTKCGTISQDMLESDKYYKFKVVRNPFNRVVSSYIHIMKYNVTHLIFSGWRGKKAESINKDVNKNILAKDHPWNDLSFEEFLTLYKDFIRVKLETPRLRGMVHNVAIFHFEPQSSNDEIRRFNNRQRSIFNRIVHLENFNDEISLVNQDTHMNYVFPPGLDQHVVKKSAQPNIYFGNRTFSDLWKSGIPLNYGKFYNSKTKALVQNIFANDLKVYNYSFPFSRLY